VEKNGAVLGNDFVVFQFGGGVRRCAGGGAGSEKKRLPSGFLRGSLFKGLEIKKKVSCVKLGSSVAGVLLVVGGDLLGGFQWSTGNTKKPGLRSFSEKGAFGRGQLIQQDVKNHSVDKTTFFRARFEALRAALSVQLSAADAKQRQNSGGSRGGRSGQDFVGFLRGLIRERRREGRSPLVVSHFADKQYRTGGIGEGTGVGLRTERRMVSLVRTRYGAATGDNHRLQGSNHPQDGERNALSHT